ncbi:alpha/beta hydrolase family protein [Algivirga pacifica]|uniref:Alpha/beta hydrolase family protein n=1 Tax=Algivirga pacifica TaxID=1162670 RepID=A0ABP9D5V5_9BACT
MKTLFAFFLILWITNAYAADTLRVEIPSKRLKKTTYATLILPSSYQSSQDSFPSVYLLHGYTGDHTNFPRKIPELQQLADELEIILISTDAGNSWYLDSPEIQEFQYESYMVEEVIPWIDAHYRTLQQRKYRAISGLSMGGHGALYLSGKHPELFGAAASMSGGVDFTQFTGNFELKKLLGDYNEKPQQWKEHTIIGRYQDFKNKNIALFIDCGVDDFFIEVNRALHQKMLEAQIPHIYMERPGKHSWDYWRESVVYHLRFFDRYFQQ